MLSSLDLFPDSNRRLTVGLKPLGKAYAQHAIESDVPSGFSPYSLAIRLGYLLIPARAATDKIHPPEAV